MLKIANGTSNNVDSIKRTALTNHISCFSIQSKENVLKLAGKDFCISIIFNYGQAVEVQTGNSTKEIQSNQFNLAEIHQEELRISSSSEQPELSLFIITLPLTYFNEIVDYFSIKPVATKKKDLFFFTDSRDINNEVHYNLQTLHINHTSAEATSVYVHGKLLTILALLLPEEEHKTTPENKNTLSENDELIYLQMNRIEKLIRNDWKNTYSIKELAKVIGTNECYLKRDFKTVFGMPVNAYRLKKKMEHAKNLLFHSKESIKSISKKLGYKYTPHFTSAYKKYYNITPGELRKKVSVVK